MIYKFMHKLKVYNPSFLSVKREKKIAKERLKTQKVYIKFKKRKENNVYYFLLHF